MPTKLHISSMLLSQAGFPNGFSLRTGGVSEAPYESLNLGRKLGDNPEHVATNLGRFCDAFGGDDSRLYEVSQVHGCRVLEVDGATPPKTFRIAEADALYTAKHGLGVGVRTADCVPLLVADPTSRAVAAVHAGWRGVAQKIINHTIDILVQTLGVQTDHLLVAIGPHIRAEAFEVSDEVAQNIARSAPHTHVILPRKPRPHVDLAAALRAQLTNAGIDASRIDDVGGCTHREIERFFSHRRDHGQTGRHLSAIFSG